MNCVPLSAQAAFYPVRDKWWRMTGSNRRPPACKAGALPAELIPQDQNTLNFPWNSSNLIWWVWLDSNQRPLRYQHSALTSWATDPHNSTKNPWKQHQLDWWPMLLFYTTTDKNGREKREKASFPERRWSSRTFRYGYLVTTSPQSRTLPW